MAARAGTRGLQAAGAMGGPAIAPTQMALQAATVAILVVQERGAVGVKQGRAELAAPVELQVKQVRPSPLAAMVGTAGTALTRQQTERQAGSAAQAGMGAHMATAATAATQVPVLMAPRF